MNQDPKFLSVHLCLSRFIISHPQTPSALQGKHDLGPLRSWQGLKMCHWGCINFPLDSDFLCIISASKSVFLPTCFCPANSHNLITIFYFVSLDGWLSLAYLSAGKRGKIRDGRGSKLTNMRATLAERHFFFMFNAPSSTAAMQAAAKFKQEVTFNQSGPQFTNLEG